MPLLSGYTAMESYLDRVTGIGRADASKSWLDYQHRDYRKNARKWVYARDHYTGEAVDPEKIQYYLVRKALGETIENFDERLALADYTPHFGTLVDELAGMIFGSEEDANRTWGSLGDPVKKPTSPAGVLWRDANEAGDAWKTLWKLLAIELTAIHAAWLFVDGGTKPDHPRVRILPAETVKDWLHVGGVLKEALIEEVDDPRGSLQDASNAQCVWLHLTVAGWQRYTKDKKGNAVALARPGDKGTWKYQTRSGVPTIPLVPVSLPLRRHVGYLLARKACAIFNQESARDNLVRFCNFPILNIIGNDKTYKAVVEALKKGARALQNLPGTNAHAFIAPDGGPAATANAILERKVLEFYRTGFKNFEDVARERVTATEVKARLAGGVFAFLTLMKSALEDAENATLYLLEQTFFPRDSAKWGTAEVARSDDFIPVDVNEVVERLRKRYFGDQGIVPVGRTARIAAALTIAQWDGIEVNEKEVAAAVDLAALQDAQSVMKELAIPAVAKAEMTVRFLVVTGYVSPDDETLMADGQKQKTIDVQKVRAESLAKATEDNTLRDAAGGGLPFGG